MWSSNPLKQHSDNIILFLVILAAASALAAVVFSLWHVMTNPIIREERTAGGTQEQRAHVPRPDATVWRPGMGGARPVAVVIDNHFDARPLSGITEAPLIVEVPVEGPFTRLIALFAADRVPEKVGPVRSLRPYCFAIARAFDAVVMHVGGSPEALAIADASAEPRLNQFFQSQYFWRSPDRAAPHNVYTAQALIRRAFDAFAWESTDTTTAWRYDDAVPETEMNAATVRVPYAGTYAAAWTWDADARIFRRSIDGSRYDAAAQDVVHVANVVIIATDVTVIDAVGRKRVRTTGTGAATYLRDGRATTGTWTRQEGEQFVLMTADGADYALAPGKTWIHIVPGYTEITVTAPVQHAADDAMDTDR